MKNIVIALPIAAFALLGFQAVARADAPSVATIRGVSYSGTGCPDRTVDASISTDKSLLYLGFDQFVAQTVPGGPSIARKNCNIHITMHFDTLWSVALSSVDYRGFAGLKAGVIGEQVSSYFFVGMTPLFDSRAKTRIAGPFSDNYARTDKIGVLSYSPCGTPDPELVINTEVRVNGIDGQMTVDTIIHKIRQSYGLVWKRCR